MLAFFSKDIIHYPEKGEFVWIVVESCLNEVMVGLLDFDALLCRGHFEYGLTTFNFPARNLGFDLLNEKRSYIFPVWSKMFRL